MLAMMSACGPNTPPPVELWLAGDVYLARSRPVVDEALAAELRGFGVVNLEGPVGAALPGDGLRLVHDPASLRALAEVGIVAASVANNHAADAGSLDATVAALGDVGIAAFGGDRVATRAGASFAAFDLEDGVPQDLAARLSGAVHPLVVSFHVTGVASPEPSAILREAVDVAVAARAEVIVAHGTHVFAPVERRDGSVIAWGLGNLAFDCRCTNHTDGLALVVSLGPTTTARVVPLHAGLEGAPARLAVDAEAYLDTLGALSPTPLTRDATGASF